MKTFQGDIKTIIDLFKFKKFEQSELEDSIYEVYDIEINKDLKIELFVEHYAEEIDMVRFNLVKGREKIRLKIATHVDLSLLIEIIK
jgi:hypothetical protein